MNGMYEFDRIELVRNGDAQNLSCEGAENYRDRYRQTEPLTETGNPSDADRRRVRLADGLNIAAISDDHARRDRDMRLPRALATRDVRSLARLNSHAPEPTAPNYSGEQKHADDYRQYLKRIGEVS